MARKPSDMVQLKLRFPEKLRLRIEAAADRNQRSMNSEIVHRLEQSFQDQTAVAEAAGKAAATTVLDKFLVSGWTPKK